MTLRLYADRKAWDLGSVRVELSHERVHARDCAECEQEGSSKIDLIRRYIVVSGAIDEAQAKRLLQISERCPVHRTLEGGPTILTELDVVPG
ncbi:MAG: OsmC family protein [Chloroflexi bacterium]|nr:OsmC family protein [Chloroflexota bacterium]